MTDQSYAAVVLSNVGEVLDALADGRDVDVEGLAESMWFEAKSAPYRLTDAKSVWELAKDVSAMANARGGVIAIAAKTARLAGSLEEVVTSIGPFPQAMFDHERAHRLLQERLFPPLDNAVRFHWYPRHRNGSVLAIEVDGADDDNRPVLVKTTATVEVDGTTHSIDTWAVATRVGASTSWDPAPKIWADIRDGRLARRSLTLPASALASSPVNRRDDRVHDLVAVLDLADTSYWALAAYPERPIRLPGFYSPSGVRGALARLPQEGLRPAGFGLGYGLDITSLGSGLAVVEPGRRGLLVDADGLVVAVAAGTPEMLGWAAPSPADERSPLRVNPFVLTEWPAEFCRFVHTHIEAGFTTVGWRYWSMADRLQSAKRPMRLTLAGPVFFEGSPAAVDHADEEVEMSDEWEVDAFRLIETFVAWFGASARDLPFVDGQRVTADSVRNMR